MRKVGVIFGGQSVEHDISVLSGVMVANAIDKTKYDVFPIYIDKNGKFFTGENLLDIDFFKNFEQSKLKRVTFIAGDRSFYYVKRKKLIEGDKLYAVINCTHGERGEDGSLSSIMKMSGIPLASPNTLASSVSMDKYITKIMLRGLGVKTLSGYRVKSLYEFQCLEKTHKLKYPLIVKPNSGGSSIGISKVDDKKDAPLAVINALKYSESAQIERYIENFIEINCACYKDGEGNIVLSECERPLRSSDILSFTDKYTAGDREFPAKIPEEVAEKIKSITKKVYTELNFEGIIRIDFMYADDNVYLNEINGVPGSLAYYLFCDTLKEFSEILSDLIEGASRRYVAIENTIKTFETKVLFGLKTRGAKHLKN